MGGLDTGNKEREPDQALEEEIMNTATLNALHKSIKHWQRLATGKARAREEVYATDCALCKMFLINRPEEVACQGCPVMVKTGLWHCQNTPYNQAEDRFHDDGKRSKTFKAAAEVQLAFLKSLLPAEIKP